MDLKIELIGDPSNEQLVNFNGYLSRQKLEGVDHFKQIQHAVKEGEMSAGALTNVFSVILDKLGDPIVEVIKCLSAYSKLFKSNITIENSNGDKLTIDGKLDAKELIKVIQEFKKLTYGL